MTRIVADVAATGDTVEAVAQAEPTKVAGDGDKHEITVWCTDDVGLVQGRQYCLFLDVRGLLHCRLIQHVPLPS